MVIRLSLGDFYGIDSMIDLMIVFVSLLVSFQSHKIFKLIRSKNYRIFSWAFLSIAIAYFFKIIVNLTALYHVTVQPQNFVQYMIHEFNEMHYANFISATLFKSFLLLGFLTLFLLTTKTFKREDIILFAYLGIISILFSVYFDFVFFLTLVMLLIFLTIYFYNNHKKNKSKQSYLSYLASIFILAGYTTDIFYGFNPWIYLLGEIFVFTGFLVMFSNHIKTKHEQKKNKA